MFIAKASAINLAPTSPIALSDKLRRDSELDLPTPSHSAATPRRKKERKKERKKREGQEEGKEEGEEERETGKEGRVGRGRKVEMMRVRRK